MNFFRVQQNHINQQAGGHHMCLVVIVILRPLERTGQDIHVDFLPDTMICHLLYSGPYYQVLNPWQLLQWYKTLSE